MNESAREWFQKRLLTPVKEEKEKEKQAKHTYLFMYELSLRDLLQFCKNRQPGSPDGFVHSATVLWGNF